MHGSGFLDRWAESCSGNGRIPNEGDDEDKCKELQCDFHNGHPETETFYFVTEI